MKRNYELDTVGHMFSSSSGNENSSVFRVSVVMREEVDPVSLQKAVDILSTSYTHLFQKIRHGVFWHYFDDNPQPFTVEEEKLAPCQSINPVHNNGYSMRILYYHHRISVEVFHALTDGGGALEFLKSLVYYYLEIRGTTIDSQDKVLKTQDISRKHFSDDFVKSFKHTQKTNQKGKVMSKDAYNVKGKRLRSREMILVSGECDASLVNKVARAHGTTMTGFITALMMESIYESYYDDIERLGKPLVITIPVSLRKMFGSQSLKNFFETVNITSDGDGGLPLKDKCMKIDEQLKRFITVENMEKQAASNVKLESHFITKLVPLLVKNPLIKLGFNTFGERKKTMTVSNLGRVLLPDDMMKHIERFEAVLYPTRLSPVNCGVVSVNNRLVITMSRRIESSEIIQHFFKGLSAHGIDVKVNSNQKEVSNGDMS